MARFLSVPDSTLRSWAQGYDRAASTERRAVHGEPILTRVDAKGQRGPTIPFVGLAEGLVLAAIRRSGVPLQRIRPALARLQEEVDLPHALASKRLFTDGAEILLDYANSVDDADSSAAVRELVVVRNQQSVFVPVVSQYLKCLTFGPDGYPTLIKLPGYEFAEVLVDPARSFGRPFFARGGARVEDVVGLFTAGESLESVVAEYGVPQAEVEDVLRVAVRDAA